MAFIRKYLGKEPIEITAKDVKRFVKRKIEESITLDYKDIAKYENADELSKHVCAFANTEGGLIFLGVSEETEEIGRKKVRVYPKEITWGSPLYSKEDLEKKLKTSIDPPIPLKIVPIRKSKSDSSVIFLLDIPKTNEIHFWRTGKHPYKRLNFESVPMERDEIISFIRVRLSYDRCALFRYYLDDALMDFIDSVVVRLTPYSDYGGRDYGKEEIELFRKFVNLPEDERIKIVKSVAFGQMMKFGYELSNLERDLEETSEYPHEEITPEERALFDDLKDKSIVGLSEMWIRGVETSLIDEEDFLPRILPANLRMLTALCKEILQLKDRLEEIKKEYGDFADSKPVRELYPKVTKT